MSKLSKLRVKKVAGPALPVAVAHNRLVSYLARTKGGAGVKVTSSDDHMLIEGTKVANPAGGGGGGTGLPDGYTFEEFTICVDGAPETRWWPTWESDPS